MTLDGHVLGTGKDGRLVGTTPREAAALLDHAFGHERVVVHVHGGLVDEAAGRRTAQNLLPAYQAADAFPVFLVWRSGVTEILRHNILEIAREEIFERLLRLLLGWSVGKVREAEEGTRAGAPPLPGPVELDRELAARLKDTDPARGSEPFAADEPAAAELTDRDEELFLAQVAGDEQLRAQLAGVAAARGRLPEGTRAAAAVTPRDSRMDDEALDEIAGPDEGTREIVSTLFLARKALQVLKAVIDRYRGGTDSGVYPTVVEELLRAFYLGNAGGAVWNAM